MTVQNRCESDQEAKRTIGIMFKVSAISALSVMFLIYPMFSGTTLAVKLIVYPICFIAATFFLFLFIAGVGVTPRADRTVS